MKSHNNVEKLQENLTGLVTLPHSRVVKFGKILRKLQKNMKLLKFLEKNLGISIT